VEIAERTDPTYIPVFRHFLCQDCNSNPGPPFFPQVAEKAGAL
jgi:hypothetical protein